MRPVARGADLIKQSLRPIDALIQKANLGGDVAFSVAHVDTGLVLEEHNPGLGLPPASVAKALTATYALAHLGPDFRFATKLLRTGPVENGTLRGDLILAGGGDPTLDTNGLATMAADLKAAGIHAVSGKFLVYGNAFPQERLIDTDQPDQVGYNPAISSLNLNYNRVHFEWKRQAKDYVVTMDARSDKYRPEVHVASMKVIDRAIPVYTYDDKGGVDEWTVARDALGNGGARWLPVRRPALYAAEVFQTFARAHGIELRNPAEVEALPDTADDILWMESAPLSDVLTDMLKYSTNLTAEAVGLATTKAMQGRPESLVASARAMSDWARRDLGLTAVAMVDHSGLGAASRMSSADMIAVLVAARAGLGLKPLLKETPMRDEQRRAIEDHPVTVRAKTGTLNFVSGLAGYLDAPDGTELAFAIFSANLDLRNALTKEERERPPGGREWNRRARILQQDLLDRWGVLYGT
ncbi:D-alanyl-D-alanine carboxypeptidase DacB [Pseudoprimorskyibacter insulae]|uniref:D-alanyl-D-alanine carboxypeptidase DacB n=1 Tax=Pseudoprimorskyibacter insulae TaxID=1695997 RepID=A0A2R8AQC2_9RHOB|nr:D-alanyl-D-alanine carboxypeptidase DacB [Pseudoprimorskyibacter insulae]